MRKQPIKPTGIFHVHRTVSDMKRSIDFYVTILGFYYDHGLPGMAWLRRGDILLTISPGAPVLDLGSYFGWTVLSTTELQDLYDHLERRRQRLSAPPDPAAGRYYFFTYDPDDYPVAISYQEFENSAARPAPDDPHAS